MALLRSATMTSTMKPLPPTPGLRCSPSHPRLGNFNEFSFTLLTFYLLVSSFVYWFYLLVISCIFLLLFLNFINVLYLYWLYLSFTVSTFNLLVVLFLIFTGCTFHLLVIPFLFTDSNYMSTS